MVSSSNKFNVLLIGLGNQTLNDHLPAILRRKDISVIAVCDPNRQSLKRFGDLYPELARKVQISTKLTKIDFRGIDFAVVCVPHNRYFEIVEFLVNKKIPFIKEKPFARDSHEAKKLLRLKNFDRFCFTCTQRRYSPLYQQAFKLSKKIGKVYLFDADYKLNISRPDKGWRGDTKLAGGGCLIDMGYHILDQLLWWFGEPDKIFVTTSSLAIPRKKKYAEDTAVIAFKYTNGLQGTITLSRSAGQKKETYTIVGSKAQITGDKKKVVVTNKAGDILGRYINRRNKNMLDYQLDFFLSRISKNQGFEDIARQHSRTTTFIDRCYHTN